MTKPISILILIMFTGVLFAQSSDFDAILDSLVNSNTTYRQAKSRYEQEKAFYDIEKSLSLFDINLNYKQYDNDFTRDEQETSLEQSDVDEKDKRWRIELNKQLFSKDFDNVSDAISTRLNLLRYKQATRLAYCEAITEIFDDMIMWYEADAMQALLNTNLNILHQQNALLEDMEKQNLIDPDLLIDNLEEIEDKEEDLHKYHSISLINTQKYGNIYSSFEQSYQIYPAQGIMPDTLGFKQMLSKETLYLNNESERIAGKISKSYWQILLPEINLKLSYNRRHTDQDWMITKNNVSEIKTVTQQEEYPEGEIGISLPFNMFSNVKGKHALLKAYDMELKYRCREMNQAWDDFYIDLIASYQSANLSVQRKARLKELYERNLQLQISKSKEEPTLLGSNPELSLQLETIKTTKAKIESNVAEMKLFKAIYLINNPPEDIK